MSDQESVSANLIAKLADEAAQIYRERKRTEGGLPDMRKCLLKVLELHKLDKLSETFIKGCMSEMGRILGSRGGKTTRRNNQLRQEGFLPPLEKSTPAPRSLRFSEFLPFKGGNVWKSPLSA
jgi:hypothetical protein